MNKPSPDSPSPDDPNSTAASVARFALAGGKDVLTIGSGPAWVVRHLSDEHGRDVTWVTNDPGSLSAAAEADLTTVDVDVEDNGWDAGLAGTSFDVVILVDVLEQLREPQRLLERLLAADLVRPDGILVISVANAAHQSVVSELLVGDFQYAADGLLDESHLRWFTLKSLQRLLERAGFLVDRVDRTTRILEGTANGDRALDIPDPLRRTMKDLNEDSEVYQYVVRAVVDSSATRMARERVEFEDERRAWARERAELARELTAVRGELERVKSLLGEERTMFAAEMRLGAAELETRDQDIARLRKRRDKLIADLKEARETVRTSMYEESRGVRMAVRVVQRARKLRGSR